MSSVKWRTKRSMVTLLRGTRESRSSTNVERSARTDRKRVASNVMVVCEKKHDRTKGITDAYDLPCHCLIILRFERGVRAAETSLLTSRCIEVGIDYTFPAFGECTVRLSGRPRCMQSVAKSGDARFYLAGKCSLLDS